jgi:PASTA domain-containing protein
VLAWPRRFLLIAVLAGLCAVPAAAHAGSATFGSDLSAPATQFESHGADTAIWNPAAGSLVSPVDGEVTEIRIRGGVKPNLLLRNTEAERLATLFHFQALHPQPDGSLFVELSSGDMFLPLLPSSGSDPVTTYAQQQPGPNGSAALVNVCVRKGDVLDFNTIGASEYSDLQTRGANIQIFAATAGSRIDWYEDDNETGVGKTLPRPGSGKKIDSTDRLEMLMQAVVKTGSDATDSCFGGFRQHVFRGAEINPSPQVDPIVLRTATRTARVRIFCHGENYGGCAGTLTLLDSAGQAIGSAPFDVPNAQVGAADVQLSQAATDAIQKAGAAQVTAIADAHDKPDADPRNTSAPPPRPGVQSLTTTAAINLAADAPPPVVVVVVCTVPKLKGKTLSSAKKALTKASCKLGKVTRQKVKKKKSVGAVLSQSPKAKTVLARNAKVALTVGTSK